ncbi:uncharacterized protein LOC135110691 [Scylla paramamosain]
MCVPAIMSLAWRVCWVTATLVVTVCGTVTPQQMQQTEDDPAPADPRGPRHTDGLPLPVPVPVRHEDPVAVGGGVQVGSADPSQCPPSMPFAPELCVAPACLQHHRCPTGRACCFNGCVHTCLLAVESPPVIDWIQDTSSNNPISEESQPGLPVRYEDPAFAEGREEMVHLPGGCTLSGKQYAELQTFMESPSIEKCMCEKGEVVCSVKMFKS